MNLTQTRQATVKKELLAVAKQEREMEQAALSQKPAQWKLLLESKVPPKVYHGLEDAFCKGFSIVFQNGRELIEKGYDKENIRANHAILDFALHCKGGKRELHQLRQCARRSGYMNMAATTAEGMGLGLLGIGLPDIVLFLGTLLKGIYETALHYGFDYEAKEEQLLILKMMQTALSQGQQWGSMNGQVEDMLASPGETVSEEDFQTQIKQTASTFAVDMLLMKFIQGLPVVGVLGGLANPFYYNKVMQYVELKYRKRYLRKLSCYTVGKGA